MSQSRKGAADSANRVLQKFRERAESGLEAHTDIEHENRKYTLLKKVDCSDNLLASSESPSQGSVWICEKKQLTKTDNTKYKFVSNVVLICWYLPSHDDKEDKSDEYVQARKVWEDDIRRKINNIQDKPKSEYRVLFGTTILSEDRCVRIFNGKPNKHRYTFRIAEFKYNPFRTRTNPKVLEGSELEIDLGKISWSSQLRENEEVNIGSSCYGVIWKCKKTRTTNKTFTKKEETNIAVLCIFDPDTEKNRGTNGNKVAAQWKKDAEKWVKSIREEDKGIKTLRYGIKALGKKIGIYNGLPKVKQSVEDEVTDGTYHIILLSIRGYVGLSKKGIREIGPLEIPALSTLPSLSWKPTKKKILPSQALSVVQRKLPNPYKKYKKNRGQT